VWRTEKYLPGCLDSLLGQSLRELELIAVDDGSPDACPQILEEYAKKYPRRLRVVHIKNAGLANARNVGAVLAGGEYLGFCDSDDRCDRRMYEKLYERARQSAAEVCVCGYYNVREGDGRLTARRCSMEEGNARRSPLLLAKATGYACNKLFRRDFFLGIPPLFPTGLCFEDIPVSYCAIAAAQRVAVVREPLYYYLRRGDSITGEISERHCQIFDTLAAMNAFCRELDAKALDGALLSLNRKHLWLRCAAALRAGDRRLGAELLRRGFAHMEEQFPGWKRRRELVLPSKARLLRPLLNSSRAWQGAFALSSAWQLCTKNLTKSLNAAHN
jgi:glycosyltransferase involved in cell wall biosynthesis